MAGSFGRIRFSLFWLAGICSLLSLQQSSQGQADETISAEQVQFFESQVRPLLIQHCQKCHGPDQQKGDLRLDSRAHVMLGGESGPAIEPGKPNDSLLIQAVRYESFEMPPQKKLSDKEIEILTKWVALGAPWPGDDGKIAKRDPGAKFTDDDRNWWAFQPVKSPVPPQAAGAGWAHNEIDQFIAARLQAEQLTPAPEADRISLVRRVYFDVVGLPPTPEQVSQFVNDPAPDAYERLVDQLLASPEYGERWARHWLDLVRYADSDGYRADGYRSDAWRYRDYVIESLNSDMPYDRFVQEQIAGDEMFPGDAQALVATGYLRHGIYEYNARDVRGQWENILNEITDATADVFLGMGYQCARCHDHKFDPILQKDYFQLRAFFEPLLPRNDRVAATPEQIAAYEKQQAIYEEKTKDLHAELAKLEQKYRDQGEEVAVERFPDDIKAMIHKDPKDRLPLEEQLVQLAWRQVYFEYDRIDNRIKGKEKDQVLALRRQLAAFDKDKPEPLPTPLTACDVSCTAPPTIIPKRKTEVGPGFLTILDPAPPEIHSHQGDQPSTGRRTALALWMTRPENPLTTRVIVNRLWQSHFGRGLAANCSDFGKLGAAPTHPELLDWLTTRFLENGWKFKSLHRLILTSATYRQSSHHPQQTVYQVKDPFNTCYWRAETRRLDAEQIRDAIFAVSGQLDWERGGPGVLADRPRRSIYTRFMRNSRDPLLDVFDLPQFFSSTGSRDTTTTPIQSLLLINSQTMLRHAGMLARHVSQGQTSSEAGTPCVEELWRWTLGRAPRPEELQLAKEFLQKQAQCIRQGAASNEIPNITTGKVPYRDGQAVLFQPEGEQERLVVAHHPRLDVGDFTVEAYFQLRSVYDSGSVRTLASKWSGDRTKPGWAFGISGKGSRRKPQTLVMQICGHGKTNEIVEAAIFSDQTVELNKPYYAAASVQLATADKPGEIRFYLKDLSNDDEPMQKATIPLQITGGFENREPLSLGSRGLKDGRFHGLIDDIRIVRDDLPVGQLLYTHEKMHPLTAGHWQFEPDPGVFRDTGGNGLHIRPVQNDLQQTDPDAAAFVDLCHILLNSNEFLYVD